MTLAYPFAVGSACTNSLSSVRTRLALCTSTIGVSPVTVIVSARSPTFRSALTVATNAPDSSIPSRLYVLNPFSVNATVYMPDLRFMIRYCPIPSVTTVRTFSMSAGLAASTVTPGRTAPDASLTTPVMDDWASVWADAAMGNSAAHASTATAPIDTRITSPLPPMCA